MVSVTVPAGYSPGQAVGATDPSTGLYTITPVTKRAATTYVFDAVLSAEHDQTLTKTHHPVQTGASVSSHAYIEPAQLVLYVLMSDVAQQFTAVATAGTTGQPWTGSPSKSISAYQQMLTLQAVRVPLTVVTRLRTYQNMLILKVSPREDDKTITGARFRIEFEQLFVANTQATPVSARPNDTDATGLGAVNVQPPSSAVVQQFAVPPEATVNKIPGQASAAPQPTTVNVPGAGTASSTPQQFGQQPPGVLASLAF